MDNLRKERSAFIRDLSGRLLAAHVGRKVPIGKNQDVSVDANGEVLKQCVRTSENLWEALYRYHPED